MKHHHHSKHKKMDHQLSQLVELDSSNIDVIDLEKTLEGLSGV